MQKQSFRLIILLVCIGLLIVPSATSIAQVKPVAILILDQFTTRTFGLDPDPGSADEYLTTLLNIIEENSGAIVDATNETLLTSLQLQPRGGLAALLELTQQARGNYATGMAQRIADEVNVAGATGDNCVGYLPGLRRDTPFIAGAGLYYINGAGGTSGEAHGLLVSHAIIDAVASSVVDENGDHAPDIRVSWGQPADDTFEIEIDALNKTILVAQADTASFHLSTITDQIQSLSSQFQWVINASFVVIPCQALPELATLEGILRAIQKYDEEDSSIDLFTALGEAIDQFTDLNVAATGMVQSVCVLNNEIEPITMPSGNPFITTNDDCRNFEDALSTAGTFVAAAGNAGLPYSFYPASAPLAISVSATHQDAPFFASGGRGCVTTPSGIEKVCSNAGEVLMPGLIQPNGIPYYGTSFAAPRLTLRLAVYLAQHDSDVCDLASATTGLVDVLLSGLPTLLDLATGAMLCEPLLQTRDIVFHD